MDMLALRPMWLAPKNVQVQHPTVFVKPFEKDTSPFASLNALVKAVTRHLWFRSNIPSPYSTKI